MNPTVSVKISGSDSLYVTIYDSSVRCKSCLEASVTDRSIITIRQWDRGAVKTVTEGSGGLQGNRRPEDKYSQWENVCLRDCSWMYGYGALTLEPRSLKIISTSKILPNCCRGQGGKRRAGGRQREGEGERKAIISTWYLNCYLLLFKVKTKKKKRNPCFKRAIHRRMVKTAPPPSSSSSSSLLKRSSSQCSKLTNSSSPYNEINKISIYA